MVDLDTAIALDERIEKLEAELAITKEHLEYAYRHRDEARAQIAAKDAEIARLWGMLASAREEHARDIKAMRTAAPARETE